MTVTRFNPKTLTITETDFMPQEEMLEEAMFFRKLTIGLPKENNIHENRVALVPEAVNELTNEGHIVFIEKGFSDKSKWNDKDYTNAGAQIMSQKDVYNCETVVKVSPFNKEEINLLRGHQTVISALHANTQTAENIQALIKKKITAIAYELIKEDDDFYPFWHSMNEISGILAITTASKYLSSKRHGKGMLLGGITGITPTEIVILGAGIASEYAAKAALGLGATIKIFDNSISKLQDIKNNLPSQISTSTFRKKILAECLKTADIVIGALDFKENERVKIVTDDMVKAMKKGSVIIDLNTDNYSYIETSHVTNLGNPIFEKYDIVHYCVPNIASEAPYTASILLSNALHSTLTKISKNKHIMHIIKNDMSIRNGIYVYEGLLTNMYLAKKFKLPYKDIDLLTAIF